jgi:hypothetical protein
VQAVRHGDPAFVALLLQAGAHANAENLGP